MTVRHPLPQWAVSMCATAACCCAAAWVHGAESDAPAPLPAEEAARTMIVPEGFNVTLFAGEPDIRQPIGFCIDDRGRLWVAEAYSYPQHSDQPGRDRIVIFEDQDHDGRHDRRTVFFEGLNYVTGVEVGFGGAWVMSPPYFYFIPDRDRDDVPDAPPRVLLDGFGNHANSHNLANGFAWGPDGWLYGTHGRTNWSLIGKPGAADEDRVRFDGGVWRYHPVRHVWEPYCDGTTNPWGIDWDDWGEAFISNCINPHLFHVIPGAHYEPWRDRESSRYAYERIATIADHLHYTGAGDVRDGLGSPAEDVAGGGHAHCGTMVYLGDNWPDGYRNTVFLNNIHGKRINNDVLHRAGSGYVASHGPDIMRSRDPWMMGVTLQYGPDGSVFVLDWSDTGECHSVKNTQRETGRIFRLSYGDPEPRRVDVATLSDEQLVQLQLHPNDWFVRHARRVLQERLAAGRDLRNVAAELKQMLRDHPDVARRLRALWALHGLSALSDDRLVGLLGDPDEHLRAWAVTLLCEDRDPPAAAMLKFVELASRGTSPLVRLHLASALQRLPRERRWDIASALVQRADDTADQNLPLMDWYAIEPLVSEDLERFAGLAEIAKIPLVRRHVARRIASLPPGAGGMDFLVSAVARIGDAAAQRDVLEGTLQGLEGRRSAPMPDGWRTIGDALLHSTDPDVQDAALRLALIFDDPAAVATLTHRAGDRNVDGSGRCKAIEALVARHVAGLDASLIRWVHDEAIRSAAIRGLAEYKHPDTAKVLLRICHTLPGDVRQDALQTLVSRAEWAGKLLDAVEEGDLPRTEITAWTARQIRSLDNERLSKRLTNVWGEVRETPADRARVIAELKRRLTPAVLAAGDAGQGRAHFKKLCANCHKLFDDGGRIGPDLTGSQRRNLDYLLENIFDPSAAVGRDYQLEVLQTTAGRVITGLVIGETDAALTIATVNEQVVVPRNEIELRRSTSNSLMPEGLLTNLTFDQQRDLVAYLVGDSQPPLPSSAAAGGGQ